MKIYVLINIIGKFYVHVCVGLTDSMRKNFSMMTALSLHTRIVPEKRIKKLMAFNKKLHDKSEALNELKQWDLQLENKLVEIQGRKLPMEHICFYDNDNIYAGEQGNWKTNALVSTIKLEKWMVLCETECRDKWQVLYFHWEFRLQQKSTG